MLVLKRKLGERIVVTVGMTVIEIEVCDVGGNWAKIGVAASHEVAIHRKEVQELIDKGQLQ